VTPLYEGRSSVHGSTAVIDTKPLPATALTNVVEYSVITNLTGAMAKRYVCPACNRGVSRP
jgi:hypothetical protein